LLTIVDHENGGCDYFGRDCESKQQDCRQSG
jgi:hypothetical protein